MQQAEHAHDKKQGRANRLINETSPYLLQHAYNPVDWRPWGTEAFEEARRRDVPILLSIGYSTCYWCHVMERETFEDEDMAELMNEKFVCIKLDREERPDVDEIYMSALQIMTGSGGWPLNILLEPDKLRPFWGGTYFPPEDVPGRRGFRSNVLMLSNAWDKQRPAVMEQAGKLADLVRQNLAAAGEPVAIGRAQVEDAVVSLVERHDRVNGGFGGAPKFPQPTYLNLLIDFRDASSEDDTQKAVDATLRHTLNKMATGGMNDQVGGGFHRYSTDARWLVPHFEKMLYDNGQLAELYAKASVVYNDPFYARVARRTLDYVLSEMTSPEGAFYSAQDAEVDTHEGQNYVWTRDEVVRILGEDDGAFATTVYGLAAPNFRDPHHPNDTPTNVLFLESRPETVAKKLNLDTDAFYQRLDDINARLYKTRAARKQPSTDDKILSGWNGLMIAGLARAGGALPEPRFIDAARRAADFVLNHMRDGDGSLLRSYRKGTAKIPAFLEDYAFFAHGLIELHRSGTDDNERYLKAAREIMRAAETRFGDDQHGGYFDTLDGQSDLFVRTQTLYDGAVPAGTSVMLANLVDLHEITGEPEPLRRAQRCVVAISPYIARTPLGAVNSTRSLMHLLRMDEPALLARFADAPDAPAALTESPVKIFASAREVVVADGKPASLTLRFIVDEGFHINAADPGPNNQDLIPLRVGVVGGTGVNAYADYAEGTPYGPDKKLRVHEGTFDLTVALERADEWAGSPTLAVTYQACTDTACLEPMTSEIDVKISRE